MSPLKEHLSDLKTLPATLYKHSTGADVALLVIWMKNKSYLAAAIPQENVLLCNNLCPVCTHILVAIKVISTFSHELSIFNNKRFNTFELSSFYSLGLMNLHMKSAKHVKMNRTSFVSQPFL